MRSGYFAEAFDIVFGHTPRSKTFLEYSANSSPIKLPDPADGGNRFLLRIDNKSGDAVLNDFRHGPTTPGDHGCSARHRLDHDQAERFRPVDRKQESGRFPQEILFVSIAYLA